MQQSALGWLAGFNRLKNAEELADMVSIGVLTISGRIFPEESVFSMVSCSNTGSGRLIDYISLLCAANFISLLHAVASFACL